MKRFIIFILKRKRSEEYKKQVIWIFIFPLMAPGKIYYINLQKAE